MPTPPRWSAGSASSRAVPRRRSFIAPRGAACWPKRSASARTSSMPRRAARSRACCRSRARRAWCSATLSSRRRSAFTVASPPRPIGRAPCSSRRRSSSARNWAWTASGFATFSHATFRKAISPDPEQNLLAIPRKQRAEVRRGIERKLVAAPGESADACWDLYAASVHRLATPVYARRYFHGLKIAFGDDCEYWFVHRDGSLVASLLNFYFRDEVLPYYAGSSGGGRDGEVHPFMYWALMNHAAARGARLFDFGRSPAGSGGYAFKKNFGFEPQPLAYEYHLVRAKHAPDADPKSPRYALVVNTWRRLPRWLPGRPGAPGGGAGGRGRASGGGAGGGGGV